MDKLRTWLKQHKAISINKIEQDAGIPANTLQQYISGRRNLPEKHLSAIRQELEKYGFDGIID